MLIEYRAGEQFAIGDDYLVTVVEVSGDEVVLAVSSTDCGGVRARPLARMPVCRPAAMPIPYLSEPSRKQPVS